MKGKSSPMWLNDCSKDEAWDYLMLLTPETRESYRSYLQQRREAPTPRLHYGYRMNETEPWRTLTEMAQYLGMPHSTFAQKARNGFCERKPLSEIDIDTMASEPESLENP